MAKHDFKLRTIETAPEGWRKVRSRSELNEGAVTIKLYYAKGRFEVL